MSKEADLNTPRVIAYDSDAEETPQQEPNILESQAEDDEHNNIETVHAQNGSMSTNSDLWASIGPEQQASLEALQKSMQQERELAFGTLKADPATATATHRNDSSPSSSNNHESSDKNNSHISIHDKSTFTNNNPTASVPIRPARSSNNLATTTTTATSHQHRLIAPYREEGPEVRETSSPSQSSSQPTLTAPKSRESLLDKGKPMVGSDEWHRLRRENHKQVERRRREAINDGINEIAKLVPGSERNKGSILQRAAAYIRQLKEAEASTIEKWTLEKLLTDQAINELNRQIETLKSDLEKSHLENALLKKEIETIHHLHQQQQTSPQQLQSQPQPLPPSPHQLQHHNPQYTEEENRKNNGINRKRSYHSVDKGDEIEVMATVISALEEEVEKSQDYRKFDRSKSNSRGHDIVLACRAGNDVEDQGPKTKMPKLDTEEKATTNTTTAIIDLDHM